MATCMVPPGAASEWLEPSFKLTPTGGITTLVRFGIKPPNKKGGGCTVELLQASDGNFYGTCPIGGDGNGGTVFKMTPSGAFTNLVEFSNNDPKGAQPHAPLAEGNDGNLYGTTTVGGAYNYGTIFRITPSGLFKVLWNFNNPNKIHECQHPGPGPLLKDKEGNFYGTTKWGGRSDWGTVFKLTVHGSDMQTSTAPPANSPSRATSQPAQMEQTQSSAQKEQLSKGNRSQSNDQTSDVFGLEATKAEASKKQTVANPSQTNAPAQAETGGKQTSPDCTSDSKNVWSEASADKRLLATIRFVPNPDKNWRAIDELKVTVSGAGKTASRGRFSHQPPSAAASFSALTGVVTHNFCCSPRALPAEGMEGGILRRSSIVQATIASGATLRMCSAMSSPRTSALSHQTLRC